MNRTELVEALSKETGLAVRKAEQVVRMAFNSMANALVNDERVEIRGFGSFSIKHYDGYMGRNPKTGELIRVKPKKQPYFKCGKELKERVDIYI
jgi:integration host factor subunit beta